VKVRIVDFHAEATSEKVAMGWYLDGRVSASSARTPMSRRRTPAFCPRGPPTRPTWHDRPVRLGDRRATRVILRRFLTSLPIRMEAAKKGVELHAVIVEVDESTGRARSARRYTIAGIRPVASSGVRGGKLRREIRSSW